MTYVPGSAQLKQRIDLVHGAIASVGTTRAQFVALVDAGYIAPIGTVVDVAGMKYRYIGSGTAISTLPGWIPHESPYPDHWVQNVTPGTTSMSAAIAAADEYCAANGGVLRFLPTIYRCTSAQTKDDATFWEGAFTNSAAGGVGTVIEVEFNGVAFTITGAQTNYQGGVSGIRVLGNRSLYPDAIAFDCYTVNDHFFNNCYMGNLKYGVRGENCKTFNFNWFYGFGMLTDSVYLRGDSTDENTDHCFMESQFAGDRYGLHIENGGSMQVSNCRPQVSGVANCYFNGLNYIGINGGYCDSARAYNGNTGTGDGMIFRNCGFIRVNSVDFHSNGAGSVDIRVIADDFIGTDVLLTGNMHKLGTSVTRTAVAFDAPIGTGEIRRVGIHACNFVGMTTAIAGPENVATELRAIGNHGIPEYVGLSKGSTDTAAETFPYHAKRFRIVGTLNADFDVNIPNARAFVGDELILIRENAGTGTITLKGPNGAAVGTLTGPGQLMAYCTAASPTAGSTTYKV